MSLLEAVNPTNGQLYIYGGDVYKRQEYKQLIEKAHARGIKIVMDMIFNHCGVEHVWIKDMPSKDSVSYTHLATLTLPRRLPQSRIGILTPTCTI